MRFLNYTRAIYFVVISLWVLLSSCTVQKRLNRLLDRHPELKQNEIIKIDTVLQVVTPKDSLSLKIPFLEIKDTVYFESELLTIEVWRDSFDTLYIDAKCQSDTLYIPFETTVEVEKIFYKKARDKLIWWVVLAIVVLIIIITIKKLLA